MLGLHPANVVRAAEESLMRGVPEGSLMQRAAFGLAVECTRLLSSVLGYVSGSHAVLLIGSGNNGGDALFAGAALQRRGVGVTALTVTEKWHRAGAQALAAAGGRLMAFETDEGRCLNDADLVIDGLVGIGVRGSLREEFARAVRSANATDALRVAVDVPSGLGTDDGQVLGSDQDVFHADLTVTFGCPKPGHYLFPGPQYCGAVRVVDIGLHDYLPDAQWSVMTLDDVCHLLPSPSVDSHKYTRGVVGVCAGSPRYPGAARLVAGGARHLGAGMVTVLDRGDGIASQVIEAFPDAVMSAADPRGLDRVTAWVAGPGFTGEQHDAELLSVLLEVEVPVVFDAGALRTLAAHPELVSKMHERYRRGGITVVTPHTGEYRELTQAVTDSTAVAKELGAIVVRKGPSTTITAPDGSCVVDSMGTADLACAGSGDVLAGMIAGLLAAQADAQDVDEVQARDVVAAAVWLHGLAGRLAARDDRPALATDLVTVIPEAVSRVRRGDLAW